MQAVPNEEGSGFVEIGESHHAFDRLGFRNQLLAQHPWQDPARQRGRHEQAADLGENCVARSLRDLTAPIEKKHLVVSTPTIARSNSAS